MIMPSPSIGAAILGTGNIGSDLMCKLVQRPGALELRCFAGIDPASRGLQRAREMEVPASAEGVEAILADDGIEIVFDATSAPAHRAHAARLTAAGKRLIDLTPAALGPACVPCVNLEAHLDAPDVNLITCGGQATIPLVHAVSSVCPVEYAEIVSTVASASAGPGTRQNIDEFTVTTARGLEGVGRARQGKAIIILNPADPPILMRNTIYFLLPDEHEAAAISASVQARCEAVREYVPGYRLKGQPVFDTAFVDGRKRPSLTLLLEVEGAGDFLPPYAGNLDIMTASAWQVGQVLARHLLAPRETGTPS